MEQHTVQKAAKEYLEILNCAAKKGESLVEQALEILMELGGQIRSAEVEMIVDNWRTTSPRYTELRIEEVELKSYDALLAETEAN